MTVLSIHRYITTAYLFLSQVNDARSKGEKAKKLAIVSIVVAIVLAVIVVFLNSLCTGADAYACGGRY